MRLYTLTNTQTGEEKNFMKKSNLAKTIGVNLDRIELAIAKNRQICKKTGEKYTIEYRDVDVNFTIEDC